MKYLTINSKANVQRQWRYEKDWSEEINWRCSQKRIYDPNKYIYDGAFLAKLVNG